MPPEVLKARISRVEIFAPDEVAIVHCINRTVRRCYLLGDDPVTGKNFDHRKAWMDAKSLMAPQKSPTNTNSIPFELPPRR
jgi:hypothetical protein